MDHRALPSEGAWHAMLAMAGVIQAWPPGRYSAAAHAVQGTVFDYYCNFKGGKFAPWSDLVQAVEYDPSMPMSQASRLFDAMVLTWTLQPTPA